MHNPFRVGSIQRVGDLDRNAKQNFVLHRLAANAMLERYAVEKFHDDEGMAILLPDLMNGADIRMVQSRSRLRFALEASQSLRVLGNFVGQKLQRHKPMQA